MYEKNGAEYSTRTECIDWRYSAAILGLVKFYEYAQICLLYTSDAADE